MLRLEQAAKQACMAFDIALAGIERHGKQEEWPNHEDQDRGRTDEKRSQTKTDTLEAMLRSPEEADCFRLSLAASCGSSLWRRS